MLKHKFQKLHSTIVNSVNTDDIIDFLFHEGVLGAQEMTDLQRSREDPKQQCRNLFALLHYTQHPQAFVQLYLAIKHESNLQWLVDRIDSFIDPSLTSLHEQLDISKPKGNCT